MRQARTDRSTRQDYLYGSSAPSLSRGSQAEFEVIPGQRGASSDVATLPSSIIGAAKAVVVVAMLCCVRVGLSAASITTSIEANRLSAQIENARSYGSDLEVQQSRLSNSTHIRVEAASLGVAPPEETVAVVLGADVVATDEAGNLSLSGSIAALENQG